MKSTLVMAALIICTSMTGHAFAEDRSANLAKNHPAENYKPPKFPLPRDRRLVFRVEDYGAKGDGRTDDTAAIDKAISAAKAKGSGSVVWFSPKTYRVAAHRTKVYAWTVTGAEDITIYGNGATLLISPDRLAFQIRNCQDVTVRGFVIDYHPLPFMQGTITEIDAKRGAFVLEVHDGYPIPSDAPFHSKPFGGRESGAMGKKGLGRGWGALIEPKRRELKREVLNAWFFKKYEILQTINGKRRVKLTLQDRPARNINQISEGDRFCLPIGIHAGGIIHIQDGKNNTLEDVIIYASPSLTIGARGTAKAVFRGIRLMFKPGSDRLITSCADGFHLQQNRRGSVIERCLMEGQIDDSINIYCGPNSVKKVISGSEYILDASTVMQEGDRLEFFEPSKGEHLGDAKVVSINGERGACRVKLDKDIRGIAPTRDRRKGHQVYNRSASGEGYIVRDNIFRHHRRYAMFLKPRNGLVEGNLIYGLNGEGIVVANVPAWPEGPHPGNVMIRNNTIIDVEKTGIEIRARAFPAETARERLVDGITLENNTIEKWDGTAILMGAVKNSVLKNNIIGPVRKGKKGIPIGLQNCGDISFIGLTINGRRITSIDRKNFKIDGKSDVKSISFSGGRSKAK